MRYTDTTAPVSTPDEVLEGLAGARDQMRSLELGNVVLAVEWAKHHPAKGPVSVADVVGPAPGRFDDSVRGWGVLGVMGCVHIDDFQLSVLAISAVLTV